MVGIPKPIGDPSHNPTPPQTRVPIQTTPVHGKPRLVLPPPTFTRRELTFTSTGVFLLGALVGFALELVLKLGQ